MVQCVCRPLPSPSLLQLQRCNSGSVDGVKGILRPCLQHCKAAPQPRETGQKKRKCWQSGSDGARDGIPGKGGERNEAGKGGRKGGEKPGIARVGRDRIERERQKAK